MYTQVQDVCIPTLSQQQTQGNEYRPTVLSVCGSPCAAAATYDVCGVCVLRECFHADY